MIKVISFDLDDTLWDVKPVLIGAEKRSSAFLKEHCPQLFEHFTFAEMNERRIALWKERTDLSHQISRLRIESVKALLMDCGYPEAQARQFSEAAFEEFIAARHEVSLYEGVEDCLQRLQSQHTLVALTNGNADVHKLSIGRYFDFGIKAEDINSSKPAAPHFELTLERYNIDPQEMLHVGDHAEHDVLGAQQLGIRSVWVNSGAVEWPEDLSSIEPDFVVESVSQLPAIVANIPKHGTTIDN